MELEIGKQYREIKLDTPAGEIKLFDCTVLDRLSTNEGLGEPEYVIGHAAVSVRATWIKEATE